ncbi:hypothetical protein J2S13_003078 [Oikeobacillus pervagus]|uniref:DUF370 domain-containing protein n=1 Tax=Oikeobacillus pervagus TaxID=1325931 RepID=A0AAJ1T0V5_9BACI|nr:extracellular matrix/biofilm biosynthesis regulator RemA family protein [Oikeobacillus pervagus]MDQ0216604.1 hypothetical protein [Oikeobacillus pervagus]
MYVHVGEDVMVHTNEIISIIDKNSVCSSHENEHWINQQSNSVISLVKGDFKSVVVTADKVFLSPLSSSTLNKRICKYNLRRSYSK